MKRLIVAALVAIALLAAPARAQVAVFDAATYSAASQSACTQVQELAQTARNLLYNFQMLQNQTAMGTSLTPAAWTQGQSLLVQLGILLQNEHMVAVGQSNLAGAFQRMYPTYVPAQNYSQMYGLWDQTTQQAAQQALNAAQAQMQSVPAASAAMAQQTQAIRAAALAHNETALIEAGVQVSQMQFQATQNLSTIEALRTQCEVAYYQHEIAVGAIREQQSEAIDNWERRGGGVSPSPSPGL